MFNIDKISTLFLRTLREGVKDQLLPKEFIIQIYILRIHFAHQSMPWYMTFLFKSSKLARPYMILLINFKRLT